MMMVPTFKMPDVASNKFGRLMSKDRRAIAHSSIPAGMVNGGLKMRASAPKMQMQPYGDPAYEMYSRGEQSRDPAYYDAEIAKVKEERDREISRLEERKHLDETRMRQQREQWERDQQAKAARLQADIQREEDRLMQYRREVDSEKASALERLERLDLIHRDMEARQQADYEMAMQRGSRSGRPMEYNRSRSQHMPQQAYDAFERRQ